MWSMGKMVEGVLKRLERRAEETPLEEPVEEPEEVACEYLDELTRGLNIPPKALEKIMDRVKLVIDESRIEPLGRVYDEWGKVGLITRYERPAGFGVRWVSTGPYQGHYKAVASPEWALLREDTVLVGSEDARRLEEFHDLLCSHLRAKSIPFRMVLTPSSNLFSFGYFLFVPADRKREAEEYAEELIGELRTDRSFLSSLFSPVLGGDEESV